MKPVDYSRENLLTMEPTTLRAMIVERSHHTVEIQLYEALSKGKKLAGSTGDKVRELIAIWKERGLPIDDSPDWVWVQWLLDSAGKVSKGETVDLAPYAWKPLTAAERKVGEQIIRERRTVRHWTDQEVPDSMIDQIMEAGLIAAHGCNLSSLRFLVIREKNAPGLFKGSDIPGGPVHIVACQDWHVYYEWFQPLPDEYAKMFEKNRVLDCGAAMQNMVLMAHLLGLGGCWLTFNSAIEARLRKKFNLGDDLAVVTYMDVGFPNQTPRAPGRRALRECILARV
jgi:nitroreductase